jgi:hypothetical protein
MGGGVSGSVRGSTTCEREKGESVPNDFSSPKK